nr:hypothetical protein [Tanacetum cinerariifolium]
MPDPHDAFKPSSDDGKKVDEDPSKQSECNDQKKEENVNSTNNVNTVSSTVNVVGTNEDNELLFDLNMPALEDVGTFDFSIEDEDYDAMADMNNLDTTIQVNRRSKRQREGKEPESASALLEPATRSAGRSTTGSKSRQASASESAFVEEHVQTISQIEEPSHPVFETGAEYQPIVQSS